MTSPRWDLVVDGFGMLEAPCFDLQGQLCFTDVRPPGALLRLDDGGTVETLCVREQAGGLVAHAEGGFVVSGRTVSVLGDDGSERVVLHPVGGWGFNDLTTDAAGNVFVGLLGERPTSSVPSKQGSLWRIGPDAEAICCYDGVTLTNGLGISPDGTRLYHNDTGTRTVLVSDLVDGFPVNRRVHRVLDGAPDGMAVDESGCVWIASVTDGKLLRLTPDGDEDLVLDAPQKWVTSLCFGGDDDRDLYVVTFGGPPLDERPGAVYRTRVGVAGAPVFPARI